MFQSVIANYFQSNWETVTLFGDAAIAIIISCDSAGNSGLIKYDLRTYTFGADNTIIEGGGNRFHAKDHAIRKIELLF